MMKILINSTYNLYQSYNNYQKFSRLAGKSMEKLSSGQRINQASDDPAGLAISEKMRAQIRGMNQAERNIQDGKSLLDVADKSLEVTQDILQRLNELAVAGSTESVSDSDRIEMGKEVSSLIDQIDAITLGAEFNGKKLFDGNGAFRIATNEKGNTTMVAFDYFGTDGFGGADRNGNGYIALSEFKPGGEHPIEPKESMQNLLRVTKDAMAKVSSERSSIGAKYSRFEFAEKHMAMQSEILTSAESRIRDVDIAKETMEMAKNKMLAEASMTIFMQANQNAQQVLQLLR